MYVLVNHHYRVDNNDNHFLCFTTKRYYILGELCVCRNQTFKCSINASSVSWTSRVKSNPSLRQITMQNKRPLIESNNQRYLWAESGKTLSFRSLPFPSSYSYSHSHSHETSLAILIFMGIQWNPWEFPI